MTEEQSIPEGSDAVAGPTDEPTDEPTRTGVARVDAVVDSVSGLADRPVDEHVEVFEQAHDELRRTLDSPPDDAE
jgi:hypothetical protein